jgi:hypothetical protein
MNPSIIFVLHHSIMVYKIQVVCSHIVCRLERASLREDNAMLMDKLEQLWKIQQQQQQHLVASSEQALHEQVSTSKMCGNMWLCALVSHIL